MIRRDHGPGGEDGHLGSQRRHFAGEEHQSRIQPDSSRYTRRHLSELLTALGLGEGARVLELGCGMGRFSELLTRLGLKVTAADLSRELLDQLEARPSCGEIRTVCCDAAAVNREVDGSFDAVVGFFFLHHLQNLAPTLRAARQVLGGEGRVAFCEPNAFNPLFPIQIIASPTMSWAVDRGVLRMRPAVFRAAFAEAGLTPPTIRRYGFFPRAIANTRIGFALERGLESLRLLSPLSAFQIVSGAVDD